MLLRGCQLLQLDCILRGCFLLRLFPLLTQDVQVHLPNDEHADWDQDEDGDGREVVGCRTAATAVTLAEVVAFDGGNRA